MYCLPARCTEVFPAEVHDWYATLFSEHSVGGKRAADVWLQRLVKTLWSCRDETADDPKRGTAGRPPTASSAD